MAKNSLTRFSDRVEDYIKYRPGYPEQIITFLREKSNLTPHWKIADIGSGTGISAEMFLKTGNQVIGVEPNAPMREASEKILSSYSQFEAIDGTAEKTNIESGTIDLIVAAQAFHWFNPETTRTEFKRILKPSGKVLLIWNERETDSTPFLKAYEELLHTYATDYKEVNHMNIDIERITSFYQNDSYLTATFPNQQVFDYDGLKGRLLSSSYAPAKGHVNHEAMLEQLQRIFKTYQVNGKVTIEYETKIYLGQFE